MIGILVSGGVSGGHLNPAVTLAKAVLTKIAWIQVGDYLWGVIQLIFSIKQNVLIAGHVGRVVLDILLQIQVGIMPQVPGLNPGRGRNYELIHFDY